MGYKDPLLNTLAGLPRLIMEYQMASKKMAQDDEQFEQQMALNEKKLAIATEQNELAMEIDLAKSQAEIYRNDADNYEEKSLQLLEQIDNIETQLADIGGVGWDEKISSLPDLYKSSGGQAAPEKHQDNLMSSWGWVLDQNLRQYDESKKEFESLMVYKDALTDEWDKLNNLKQQSSKVNAYTAPQGYDPSLGDQGQIDEDDMRYYFETELTYDGSVEGRAEFEAALKQEFQRQNKVLTPEMINNKWKAHTAGKYDMHGADYEDYKELFVSWDPGDEEDRAMQAKMAEAKTLHRQGLDTLISDTYASLVNDFAGLQEADENATSEEVWEALLSRDGTNESWEALSEEEKLQITTWLSETLVKQGDAQDWYDKLTGTPEGQFALNWLKEDDQFSYRLGIMEKAVMDYNDPYKGQGTTEQQLGSELFMEILDPYISTTDRPEVDVAEIYKEFVGINAGIADKMIVKEGYDAMTARATLLANDYSNNLTEKERDDLRNLDATLNDYIGQESEEFQVREGATMRLLDRDIDYYNIQLEEAIDRGDEVAIQGLELKISEAKSAKRKAQTGAMRGFEKAEETLFELGAQEDILPTGDRVLEVLTLLDSPDLESYAVAGTMTPGAYAPGKLHEAPSPEGGAQGYEYGLGNPHDITNLKTSSFVQLDGDVNPYVEAYDEKAEEIWDDINVELRASDPDNYFGNDPFGPDFLYYWDKHPLARLEYAVDAGVISPEEYNSYKAEMEAAGNQALASRLTTILDNPTENKEDYRELIQIINKSKDQGILDSLDEI